MASANPLYSDGPANGTFKAYSIYSYRGYDSRISATFTLSSASTLTGADVTLWEAGDPISLQWSILSGGPDPSQGGTVLAGATASLTDALFGAGSGYGFGIYSVFNSSFSISPLSLGAGTYWLELQNAEGTGSKGIAWDQNGGPSDSWGNGVGFMTPSNDCAGNGSPGSGCGETFDIQGIAGAAVPEPTSIALFGSAALILAGGLRRKLFRQKQSE